MLDMVNKSLPKSGRRIEFTASNEVRDVLKQLARTEDLKFSPSNRRLAVAGYAKNSIVVFDVKISSASSGERVVLTDYVEITSSSLRLPHGLSFINEDTLILANRGGEAPILKVPPSGGSDKRFVVTALQTIRRDENHLLNSPGSVAVSRINPNLYEVLICNNYADQVTRHILEGQEQFSLNSNEIFLSKGLSIPDGVAVSEDRRWIAISNHSHHCIFLYQNTPRLNKHSEPDGILRNINYPHGARFTSDGNFLLVADAGSPYVNVYAKDGDGWKGRRNPFSVFRVLDESVYLRGRHNPQEGGPKGIDIDQKMNVLAVTCEQQPLAFFDLAKILKKREIPWDWRKRTLFWRLEWIRDDLRRRRGWK